MLWLEQLSIEPTKFKSVNHYDMIFLSSFAMLDYFIAVGKSYCMSPTKHRERDVGFYTTSVIANLLVWSSYISPPTLKTGGLTRKSCRVTHLFLFKTSKRKNLTETVDLEKGRPLNVWFACHKLSLKIHLKITNRIKF